ncbi:MAG: 50S ribosomal protein L33 [Candidatus Omnitrophota bacterium]
MREIITLECSDCKNRNYTNTRNKKKQVGRLELKKFCKFCHKHTQHKEIK